MQVLRMVIPMDHMAILTLTRFDILFYFIKKNVLFRFLRHITFIVILNFLFDIVILNS